MYDEFVEKAKARAVNRAVGDPFKSGIEQGPQVDITAFSNRNVTSFSVKKQNSISKFLTCFGKKKQVDSEQFKKVLKYIKYGIDAGATLQTGGEQLGSKGYYIQPTVFSDVKVSKHNITLKQNSIAISVSCQNQFI